MNSADEEGFVSKDAGDLKATEKKKAHKSADLEQNRTEQTNGVDSRIPARSHCVFGSALARVPGTRTTMSSAEGIPVTMAAKRVPLSHDARDRSGSLSSSPYEAMIGKKVRERHAGRTFAKLHTLPWEHHVKNGNDCK